MHKLIECVPNFSEGQRKEVIDAIAQAIANVQGVALLDVDPSFSNNRTIYTFVGHPQAVIAAALAAAHSAHDLIDMTTHAGQHPRIGAMDVVPFVPVRNATMADCIAIARDFAERLAAEFFVPVYLYGEAQECNYRKGLVQIREGEYEGLPNKVRQKDWRPDFGPAAFVPAWGATCVGARKFLVPYNVNILGSKEQAHRIALNIREEGRGEDQPGKLKCVHGRGSELPDGSLAQVSLSLTDIEITNINTVYEQCVAEAETLQVGVCGSQLIGIVPLQSLLIAAEYFIQKENLFVLEEDQKIRLVLGRLGLNSVVPFNPRERILEYILHDREDSVQTLASMELKDLVKHVGGRSLIPGGGCVTSLMAVFGAALGNMCALLTYGMRKWEAVDKEIRTIIVPLHAAVAELLKTVDEETEAYNTFLLVQLMAETTPEERRVKRLTEGQGLQNCLDISLRVAQQIDNLWDPLQRLAPLFDIQTKADFLVGVKCLETAAYGASKRLEFLSSPSCLPNPDSRSSEMAAMWSTYQEAATKLLERAQKQARDILALAEGRRP